VYINTKYYSCYNEMYLCYQIIEGNCIAFVES